MKNAYKTETSSAGLPQFTNKEYDHKYIDVEFSTDIFFSLMELIN